MLLMMVLRSTLPVKILVDVVFEILKAALGCRSQTYLSWVPLNTSNLLDSGISPTEASTRMYPQRQECAKLRATSFICRCEAF